MKTHINKLTGYALDYAVGLCEQMRDDPEKLLPVEWHIDEFSTEWAVGGLIIERERIAMVDQGGDHWAALCGWTQALGETQLKAAMRSYVASKLGDHVDVPEEIIEGE